MPVYKKEIIIIRNYVTVKSTWTSLNHSNEKYLMNSKSEIRKKARCDG